MASRTNRHIAVALGERLATARKAGGETQREVALAIGVNEMRVSNWERGISLPSARYEQELADHLFAGNLNALYGMEAAA